MEYAKVAGRRHIDDDAEQEETLTVTAKTRVTATRAERKLVDQMASCQMLILKAEVVSTDMDVFRTADQNAMKRHIERQLWLSMYDAVKKKLGL